MAKQKHNQQETEQKADKLFAMPEIPTWAIFAVFALTTLVFFRSQLFGQLYFWEDFAEYVFPVQSFSARFWSLISPPFWNPYTFCGTPFLADIQVGFFYPPHWILPFFVNNGHLSVKAVEFVIILHFFIAQCAMYFLARHWGASSVGSLISAVSYAFSSILVCHVFHPMMVYHLAWFPLIVLHFHKGFTQAQWKNALISGLLLGMTMLSGHPQSTLYVAFFLFLMTLWFGVSAIIRKEIFGAGILRLVVLAALPIVLAIGIFCIQYLPTTELASLSVRNEMSYEKASEGSLQFSQLTTAVAPKLFGSSDASRDRTAPFYLEGAPYYYYWETAFYFGIPALLLGLLGAVLLVRSRLGGFLVFASVFGFFFALGANGFLYPIFFKLPFFSTFRMPARMMFYVVFALTSLAGLGFDALWQKKIGIKPLLIAWTLPLLIALGAALGMLAGTLGTPNQIASAIQSYGSVALILTLLSLAVAFLLQRRLLPPMIAGIAFAILAFADLTIAGSAFNASTTNPEDLYKLDPQTKQNFEVQPPNNIFRVRMRESGFMAMKRNQGLLSPVMLYEGYNPLLLERVNPPAPQYKITQDLLNIRYEVVIDSARRQAVFAERPERFGMAKMMYKAVVSPSDKVSALMKSGNVDLKNEVVLEKDSPLPLPNVPSDSVKNSVQCVRYENNALAFEVSTERNGILVVSEIWYPAWQITVDGQAAELLRADYSLRGVAIPAGKHTVEMHYRSSAFVTGAWITLGTLFAGIAGLVLLRRRKE